jgi:hypothetical protein
MKNLFVREKSISLNKSYRVQIYWSNPYLSFLQGSFKLLSDDYFFKLRFSLFGDCFDFYTYWNRRMDHAGFNFTFTILGICFHFNIYDDRHWDYIENNWKNTYITDES